VDEILVVDSLSSDKTVEIAAALGARIIVQPFLGYIEQKRFAIAQASHSVILSLDADEALSDELRESIRGARQRGDKDCYWMNRLSNMGGRWIRHGGWYPDRKLRLFDREHYAVEGINPHDKFVPLAGARVGHLKGDLLHYTNEDLAGRIQTINHFSTLAARAFHERGKRGGWLRLLGKPAFRFIQEYLFKLGFLDGFYGWVIAKTSAQYVFLRESKLMELERRTESRL
jgi:glycosyltransferase involved in cell wall biosynthesis